MSDPRMPLAPLLEAAKVRNMEDLAGFLGVHYNTVRMWGKDGIPFDSADGAAVKVGLHPAQVWPEWLAHTIHIAYTDPICDRPTYTKRRKKICLCPGCKGEDRVYSRRARQRRQQKAGAR